MGIRRFIGMTALAVAGLSLHIAQTEAQTSPKQAAKPAVRTATTNANADLIKLASAGMNDEILLATVAEARAARRRYDTSADALVALKNAGVSQRVISAILGLSGGTSASGKEVTPGSSMASQQPPTVTCQRSPEIA